MVNMGAQPPYPLLYYNRRIVRKQSLCDEQKMREHVIPGNLIFGFAGSKHNFRNHTIRV